MHIAIIGAGVAGLAAGRALVAKGHTIDIFEARNEIGGRIKTDRTFTNFPIERGAEFIHGDDIITWEFLRMMEAHTIPVGSFPHFYYEYQGKIHTFAELCMLPGFKEALEIDEDELPARDPFLKDVSLRVWASQLQLAPEATAFMTSFLARLNLADPDDIGVNDLAHEARIRSVEENSHRTRDGYDLLVQFLAQDLPVHIGAPVTHVDWGGNGVKLKTEGNVHTADAVIITVPLAILQQEKIAFSPALPGRKSAAIGSLAMGDALKVHLLFREAFWSHDAALYIGAGDIFTLEIPGRFRDGAEQVLNAFIVGKVAREWTHLPEEEAVEKCLDDICRMFASKKPRSLFVKGMRSTWSDDPWIGGAYSYVPVDSYGARQVLAEPVNSILFFAGEATVTKSNPATVHGAIESGIRAAKEIQSTF